jgi:nucleoid-associated protein YgaU
MSRKSETATGAARHKSGVYVVKHRDTLKGIDQEIFHDSERWREIAKANGIENPRLLTPGMVLNILKLDED